MNNIITYLPASFNIKLSSLLLRQNEVSGYLTYARASGSRLSDGLYIMEDGDKTRVVMPIGITYLFKIPLEHRRRIIFFHSHAYQDKNWLNTKLSSDDLQLIACGGGLTDKLLRKVGLQGEYLSLLVAWDHYVERARYRLKDGSFNNQPIKIVDDWEIESRLNYHVVSNDLRMP